MIGILIGLAICVIPAIPGFWLISIGQVALGLLVILSPTFVALISEASSRIRRHHANALSVTPPAQESIRAELRQTPEWWDQQFRALVKKQIPRDAASHAGHDLDEPITFWSGGYATSRYCLDCGVTIDDYADG